MAREAPQAASEEQIDLIIEEEETPAPDGEGEPVNEIEPLEEDLQQEAPSQSLLMQNLSAAMQVRVQQSIVKNSDLQIKSVG